MQNLWGGAHFWPFPPIFWRKMGVPPHGGEQIMGGSKVVPPHPANPWGGNLLLPPIFRDRGGGIEKCSPPSVWGGNASYALMENGEYTANAKRRQVDHDRNVELDSLDWSVEKQNAVKQNLRFLKRNQTDTNEFQHFVM